MKETGMKEMKLKEGWREDKNAGNGIERGMKEMEEEEGNRRKERKGGRTSTTRTKGGREEEKEVRRGVKEKGEE